MLGELVVGVFRVFERLLDWVEELFFYVVGGLFVEQFVGCVEVGERGVECFDRGG